MCSIANHDLSFGGVFLLSHRACRLEVKHLEQSRRRALCCAGCGTGVAWEGDVFTFPGAEGVVGAYVNAMGYVHQVRRWLAGVRGLGQGKLEGFLLL